MPEWLFSQLVAHISIDLQKHIAVLLCYSLSLLAYLLELEMLLQYFQYLLLIQYLVISLKKEMACP